jgi:hypothetical protein
MVLHIGDISIDYFSDSHSESVKKLNKDKKVKLNISFYMDESDNESALRESDKLEKYIDIFNNNMPNSIISSKATYNWVFEGVKPVEMKSSKRRSKFFSGEIVETTMTFEFDSCYGINDLTAAKRSITLNKLGI